MQLKYKYQYNNDRRPYVHNTNGAKAVLILDSSGLSQTPAEAEGHSVCCMVYLFTSHIMLVPKNTAW